MALLVGGALVAGCQSEPKRELPGIQSAWEAPPAEAQADGGAGNGERAWEPPVEASPGATIVEPEDPVVATVEGQPIQRRAWVDALIEAHGAAVLEQLVLLAAVQQRAAAAGITVTDKDVEAERLDALRRVAAPMYGEDAVEANREAAERLLANIREAKNISDLEFELRMKQKAYLRKLAEREVKVDDRELPAEYERAYGEKVRVRCIQVFSADAARQAQAALEAGRDFELVAREMNQNPVIAANGGLLPPFTRYDDVPKLLRDTAFSLDPGKVSNIIRDDQGYYVIRVEARYPPSQVGIENVREELRQRIRDRLVRQRIDELEAEIAQSATIVIPDAELRQDYRKHFPTAKVEAKSP